MSELLSSAVRRQIARLMPGDPNTRHLKQLLDEMAHEPSTAQPTAKESWLTQLTIQINSNVPNAQQSMSVPALALSMGASVFRVALYSRTLLMRRSPLYTDARSITPLEGLGYGVNLALTVTGLYSAGKELARRRNTHGTTRAQEPEKVDKSQQRIDFLSQGLPIAICYYEVALGRTLVKNRVFTPFGRRYQLLMTTVMATNLADKVRRSRN